MSQRQHPGQDKPLRARDAQTVIATGIDVGVTEHQPGANEPAHHDYERERVKPVVWFAMLVLVIVVTAIVLGIFIL